jgi:hypothetical protein
LGRPNFITLIIQTLYILIYSVRVVRKLVVRKGKMMEKIVYQLKTTRKKNPT